MTRVVQPLRPPLSSVPVITLESSRDPLLPDNSILTSAATAGLAGVWGKMETQGPGKFSHVFAYQPDPEPTKWLTAAIDHGLAGSASALIDACVRTDQLTLAIAHRLLADPNGRHGVISAVIGQSTNPSLIQKVVDQLAPVTSKNSSQHSH